MNGAACWGTSRDSVISIAVAVQVQQHLDEFIAAMQELFEKHKAAAGYPDCQLVVL